MINRAIVIVLDSFGIGEAPDAKEYNDIGGNTLGHIYEAVGLDVPNMKKMGLFNIDGVNLNQEIGLTNASFGRAMEQSKGKNTPVGHWEISGCITEEYFTTYTETGFPKELIDEFIKRANIGGILGNKAAAGTVIIEELGKEHFETGYPIIYTSADSTFQIAAHNDVISLDNLYKLCEIAQDIIEEKNYNISAIVARPFIGQLGNFKRTYDRKDYVALPSSKTMLEVIKENGLDVLAVGKIENIFSGIGITKSVHTEGNEDGINKTIEYIKEDSKGLIFTNLVDFDMLYGHRRNPQGYKEALEYFDKRLEEIIDVMKDTDMLIITADHGNDPTYSGTNHTREYIPILIYGKDIKENVNLGTRKTFADISATILDILNLPKLKGESFKNKIIKNK